MKDKRHMVDFRNDLLWEKITEATKKFNRKNHQDISCAAWLRMQIQKTLMKTR